MPTHGLGMRLPLGKPQPPVEKLLMSYNNPSIPDNGDEPDAWMFGGFFLSEQCQAALAHAISCEAGQKEKEVGECDECNTDLIEVDPFIVYQPYVGGATGHDAANYPQKAKDLILATCTKRVENVIWSGVESDGVTSAGQIHPLTNVDPTMGTVADVVADGAPMSPAFALLALVQELATKGTGQPGMIHATPWLVAQWINNGDLLEKVGKRWVTRFGQHTVIGGSGYTGSGPGDVFSSDPLQQWAYATNEIFWWGSDINVTPEVDDGLPGLPMLNSLKSAAMNKLQNRFEYFAEKTVLLWRDCCVHSAVLVQLDSPAGAQ